MTLSLAGSAHPVLSAERGQLSRATEEKQHPILRCTGKGFPVNVHIIESTYIGSKLKSNISCSCIMFYYHISFKSLDFSYSNKWLSLSLSFEVKVHEMSTSTNSTFTLLF